MTHARHTKTRLWDPPSVLEGRRRERRAIAQALWRRVAAGVTCNELTPAEAQRLAQLADEIARGII